MAFDTCDIQRARLSFEPFKRRRLTKLDARKLFGGIEATSVYVRDPDGNLLEFMMYGGDSEATGGERSVEPTNVHGDTK